MKLEDFDYVLPEELIAQVPLENRAASRLMVLDKETGEVEHHHFPHIVEELEAGDCLILNDTRVLPARLIGEKKETGAHIEEVGGQAVLGRQLGATTPWVTKRQGELRKTISSHNSLAHRTTWLRSDFNFADVVSTGERVENYLKTCKTQNGVGSSCEEAVHSGTEEERRGCKCHIFLSEQRC